MTREEAIKELKEYKDGLDLEYATPFDKAILYAIKALEQEPTTKNDLGVENDLVSSIVEKISEKVTETREEFIFETIRPYCENVLQMKISKRDLEQALLKYYGKNDLGVDCISRKDVLKLMQDNWHTHNGDWAMQESMDDIRALPSVTPIRPKGHWINTANPRMSDNIVCSECGYDSIADFKFCPNCGSYNGGASNGNE